MKKEENAITLISLVITIIILLILAGVTIGLTMGENGIFGLAEQAVEETKKESATEKINLKITNAQALTYAEKGRMPTLQELANIFCEDDEIDYVHKEKAMASLEKIELGDSKTFFTKLKEYSYEFEIGDNLKILTIDGNIVNDTDNLDNLDSDNNTNCNHISSVITEYKPIVIFNNGIYLNVTNDATTKDNSNIVSYVYILNGKVYKQTNEKEILIENLEMEKEYNLQVLAIDELAKIKYSSNLKVKTENKVYLYKDGNEAKDITGGWTGTSLSTWGSSYGSYTRGKDYLYAKNTSTENYANSNYYPGWITNNPINLTNFSKIVFEGNFVGDEGTQTVCTAAVSLTKTNCSGYKQLPYRKYSTL